MRHLLCVSCLLLSVWMLQAEPEQLQQLLDQYHQAEDPLLRLAYIDSIFADHAYALSSDAYFELAWDKHELVKDTASARTLAQTYHTLGKAYINHNAYDTAISWFLKGLKVCEPEGDSSSMAKMYNGIAHCYQWSDKEKSIEYYQKAIDHSRGPRMDQFIGIQYMNMASQMVGLKQYGESIETFQTAIKYLEKANARAMIGTAYMNIGVVYYRQGNIKGSVENQERALQYLSPDNNLRSYVTNLQNLGLNYVELGDFEKAEAYTQQSLKLAEENQIGDRRAKAYLNLAAIANARQDYKRALEYHQTWSDINDSISEAQKDEKIAQLLTQFETEKKQAEIDRLDAENQLRIEKTRRERIIWIIGVVALLVIVGLISYFLQENRKKNLLLEEKNGLISVALAEKETLLREIHHRVKNNLQVISSLLSLQAKQIQDNTALEAIQEGQNRVKSMALIHQNLYQEENLVGVDVQQYVEKLIDSLVRSYKIDTAQIEVLKDIDPVKFDVDTIIPLGLILNELISNVLKYAFEGREEGKIEVSLKSAADTVTLQVADDGIGLPASFDPAKNRSLGYRLIRAFANKLNAQLDVQGQPGTRVSIRVPNLQPT